MTTTVKVEGLRDLERALAELDKHTTRRTVARTTLRKAGEVTATAAARMAPDDPQTTDDLKANIKVGTRLTRRQARLQRRFKDKETVEAYVGVTDQVNAYGHLQEFGTVHHAAQPFMRPAWLATRLMVLQSIRGELADQVKKAAMRAAKRAAKLAGK